MLRISSLLVVLLATQGRLSTDSRPEGVAAILKQHLLWLESGGKAGVRADFRGMDLENFPLPLTFGFPADGLLLSSGVVLRDADLRQADMRFARMRGIDLSNSNLQRARLNQSDLRRVALIDAELREADLSNANLAGADLRRANLNGAIFAGADLTSADLSGAKCATKEQLAPATIDADTKLPAFEICPQ
jgi:uncharacterized protein YjbI with pentapeptide repeats